MIKAFGLADSGNLLRDSSGNPLVKELPRIEFKVILGFLDIPKNLLNLCYYGQHLIKRYPSGTIEAFALEGQGSMKLFNGIIIEGKFKPPITQDNVLIGVSYYQGEWKDGKRDGFGIYRCSNFLYIGEFKKHNMEGEGIQYSHYNSDGGSEMINYANKYIGSFSINKRHGKGSLDTPFWKYEGEFFEGKMVDKNCIINKTSSPSFRVSFDEIVSTIKDDFIIDKGFHYSQEGFLTKYGKVFLDSGDYPLKRPSTFFNEKSEYDGNYLFNERTKEICGMIGFVKEIRNDKCMYFGNVTFPKNVKNGKGTMFYEYYKGDCVNGKKEGFGQGRNEDGTYYVGYFSNDKKHGPAIQIQNLTDNETGKLLEYGGLLIKGDFNNDFLNGSYEFTTKNENYFVNYLNGVKVEDSVFHK